MTCQTVQTLLLAYVDGETSPSEQHLIDTHLAGCYQCQQALAKTERLQQQLRQMLTQSAQVTPSPQAWRALQAKINRTDNAAPLIHSSQANGVVGRLLVRLPWIKVAQPLFKQYTPWLKRSAPSESQTHTLNHNPLDILGDITMKTRIVVVMMLAVVVLTIGFLIVPDTASPVSAQEIMERAAEAQATPATESGIHHTINESYFDFAALFPEHFDATMSTPLAESIIYEKYTDLTSDKRRSVTRNGQTGQLMYASGQDEAYLYFGARSVATKTLTVYRSPIPENYQPFWHHDTRQSFELDSQDLFEQARQAPDVVYVGQETWPDGRMVHVLRFTPALSVSVDATSGSVATITLADVSEKVTTENNEAVQVVLMDVPPIISTMYYDVETYQLLETRETIERDGQEIMVGYHRQLVNEILPIETSIAWGFSDLAEIIVVDDTIGEHNPLLAFAPEVLSQEDFLAKIDFTPYLVSPVPEGYTLQITTFDGFVTFTLTEEQGPLPEPSEKIYTLTYRNETGDFVEMTGPNNLAPEALSHSEADVYEAPNGVKLHLMSTDDTTTHVVMGRTLTSQTSTLTETMVEATDDVEESESNTMVASSVAIRAMPGLPFTGGDDSLLFGTIETPDGLSFHLTSNLPEDDIKRFIDWLTPVQ